MLCDGAGVEATQDQTQVPNCPNLRVNVLFYPPDLI